MAAVNKTRNMIESLVKDSSLKWLLGRRNSFSDELEQIETSPSAGRNWIAELSPLANIVVRRCSKILAIAAADLQDCFNEEASDALKHPSNYARNLLEYCCFKTLALSVQTASHLTNKNFRRLTYDMMLAWDAPAAAIQAPSNVDDDLTVGLEAFSRISPALPAVADVITCENLYEVLTMSSDGRLIFSVYDKFLIALERTIGKMKSYTDSSLLSAIRASRRERILEVDGTVTTQPVLEHAGVSTWPGRLTLTDHAIYFEAIRVVSYDKPKVYDLSEDLKQVIKADMTGPWGTRIFDKAVSYNSVSLSEPAIFEYPELKGHSRRDYWLAIIREVFYAHRFISRFQLEGAEKEEALAKALLGIARLQAARDVCSSTIMRDELLLLFNLCDQIPGGDLILETLATSRQSDRIRSTISNEMGSVSSLDMLSSMGLGSGETVLSFGDLSVGEMSELEKIVKESRTNYKKLLQAQETIDGAKVDGIDTNLAVMQELLFPIIKTANWVSSLLSWDDNLKSCAFCVVCTLIVWREWVCFGLSIMLLFFAMCITLTRLLNQGYPVVPLNVNAPAPMNTMEQLLAVQTAISHFEQLVQKGNVFLLKVRALMLVIFPQASEKVALGLLLVSVIVAFVPVKLIVMMMMVEFITRYSPLRRANSEKFSRRMKEWWDSVPAAPVVLQTDKKKK